MAGFAGRPFKVWNAERTVKKSLIASNLSELLEKGRAKLGLSGGDAHVVLEADGTEVDEEDYFSFLNSDATLMLLTPCQKWRPAGLEETSGKDEPDTAVSSGVSLQLKHLLVSLKKDVTRIITFSDDDLQSLVDTQVSDLACELGESERYAQSVKDACQRHLDDRQNTKEAVDLLRLYHHARKVSPYVDAEDGTSGKKRRHSPDSGHS